MQSYPAFMLWEHLFPSLTFYDYIMYVALSETNRTTLILIWLESRKMSYFFALFQNEFYFNVQYQCSKVVSQYFLRIILNTSFFICLPCNQFLLWLFFISRGKMGKEGWNFRVVTTSCNENAWFLRSDRIIDYTFLFCINLSLNEAW